MDEHELPSRLVAGVRVAACLPGAEIMGSPWYVDADGCWAIRVDLRTSSPNDFMPEVSSWVVLIDRHYPLGHIRVFPAKDGGVTATFPHQEVNLPGPPERPWRDGKLCLDSAVRRLGLVAPGTEPADDADERLLWHMRRAQEWIEAAAADALSADGDPFELPKYEVGDSVRVVHDESAETYPVWSATQTGAWGIVAWAVVPEIEKPALAVAFETKQGQALRMVEPGYLQDKHGSANPDRLTGFWWLWDGPIVVAPWQAPRTWGKLRAAGARQGIDVDRALRAISRRARGRDALILLLGSPIPLICGEDPVEVHWQALQFPKLEAGGNVKGFRSNEQGWWHRDRRQSFADGKKLQYLRTENWHPDRLQARGRLDEGLRGARVALVGCGALGSAVAELLVRGGVRELLLIDGDTLAAGNLVRHVLTAAEIGKGKAEALVRRLRSCSPLATVVSRPTHLPLDRAAMEELLGDRDVVVDATGADGVAHAIAGGWWSLPKLFVSASLGYAGRRVFAYLVRGNEFPAAHFFECIAPWLREERADWAAHGETLEGAGCWSPLFPARLDDIWLAAVSTVKSMEEQYKRTTLGWRFLVYEGQSAGDGFKGFSRIHDEASSP